MAGPPDRRRTRPRRPAGRPGRRTTPTHRWADRRPAGRRHRPAAGRPVRSPPFALTPSDSDGRAVRPSVLVIHRLAGPAVDHHGPARADHPLPARSRCRRPVPGPNGPSPERQSTAHRLRGHPGSRGALAVRPARLAARGAAGHHPAARAPRTRPLVATRPRSARWPPRPACRCSPRVRQGSGVRRAARRSSRPDAAAVVAYGALLPAARSWPSLRSGG